jgi:hypothetical protein
MKTHFILIVAVLCLCLETGTAVDTTYTIGSNSITFTWKTNLFAADLEQANNIEGPWGYVSNYSTPCPEWKHFEVPISTVDAEIDRAKGIAPGPGCTNNCGTNVPFGSQKRFFRIIQKDNGLVPTPPFPTITHPGGFLYVCHTPIAWGCDDTLIDFCHFYASKDGGPVLFFASTLQGGLTATNSITNAGEYTFYAKAQDGTNLSYLSEASNPLTVP